MTLHSSKKLSFFMAAAVAAGCLVGCDTEGTGSQSGVPSLPSLPGPSTPGDPVPDDPLPEPKSCNTAPACNDAITVDPNGPALLVTDPAVLKEFPLEKVVTQLMQYEGMATPAEEVLQRLFDTMNTTAEGRFDDVLHCDDPENPAVLFQNGDTFQCPRAEGVLADSKAFFSEEDPDGFFPVAVVNRFDLTPIDASRCGQYRIIYGKRSGLTDPNNRVFMIFEAAVQNPMPGCLESCRPVAEFWKGLETKSTEEIATHLRTFFFAGIPGFKPAIHPVHYGMDSFDQGYGGAEGGQIRVSMHMGELEPWDMREMNFRENQDNGKPQFIPATVKNSPPVAFFDPTAIDDTGMGNAYRSQFVWNEIFTLSATEMKSLAMFIGPEFNATESAIAGTKKNDYFTAATAGGDMTFFDAINENIVANGLGKDCPPGDPLDAEAVLKRATALSCAGCHAPKDFLGDTLSIGCGMTWPDSIGQAHVTEKGEVSPALKEVFLPRRAEVLATFLQSCDPAAINDNLQPFGNGGGFEEGGPPVDTELGASKAGAQVNRAKLNGMRTIGGSAVH